MNKSSDGTASGDYTWMVNCFQKVDGTTAKLSDLSIQEGTLAPGVVILYIMNEKGCTKEVDGKKQKFVYLHPAMAARLSGSVAGWYYQGTKNNEMKGSGSAGWANDVEIPYGQGIGLQRTSKNGTLVFSGTVANADQEFTSTGTASGDYTWMGNAMPVAGYHLSDFSIKEGTLAPGVVILYIMNEKGCTKEVDGKKQKFVYLHPAMAARLSGSVAGWYYQGTKNNEMKGPGSAGWANDVEIGAGQGLGLQRTSKNGTLVVPSPLVDHQMAD